MTLFFMIFRGAGLALAVFLLQACERTPDETLIRKAISDMSAAIEQKDSRKFISHLTSDFRDHEGRDRRGIRQLLAYHLLANRIVHVFITDIDVMVNGGSAAINLRAAATGAADLFPERVQYYALTSKWEKRAGEWLVVSAEWRPLLFQS